MERVDKGYAWVILFGYLYLLAKRIFKNNEGDNKKVTDLTAFFFHFGKMLIFSQCKENGATKGMVDAYAWLAPE